MPKENETVTVSVLREMFVEHLHPLIKQMDHMDAEFGKVHAQFAKIDAKFTDIDTEFARVHREIAGLRDDIVDVLDESIIPQIEEHRRDIALLKRVVAAS